MQNSPKTKADVEVRRSQRRRMWSEIAIIAIFGVAVWFVLTALFS